MGLIFTLPFSKQSQMNILLLGSGGREHAIGKALKENSLVEKIFFSPGNAGTCTLGANINVDYQDYEALRLFIQKNGIELVIIGPEAPLVAGLADQLLGDKLLPDLKVLGPGRGGAMLEGSKSFAKKFMKKFHIPTADYLEVSKSNLDEGLKHLDSKKGPYVLKADGLAAGKGVLILEDRIEAKNQLKEMLDGKFGAASSKVVIEEFLDGIEFSVFILTDGDNFILLPEAKDYKRIGEGDLGPNTGGMGSVSPVPFFDEDLKKQVIEAVIRPTIKGLREEKIPYCGFIFFGLILCGREAKVIEYNCRMGDPETQVVIPRLKTDLLGLILGTIEGKLSNVNAQIKEESRLALIAASGGYPDNYKKGIEIFGLDQVKPEFLFHAGTEIKDGKIVTSGGRVLAISCSGETLQEAMDNCYSEINKICFDGIYYRKDIGKDLLK